MCFGFPVLLRVGGFGFFVVVVEAWAVVEVVGSFVWIFYGRLWLWLRVVGGFRFFFCGCWFLMHSFGFFVWPLVVLMVVDSRFAVGGGDGVGIQCGLVMELGFSVGFMFFV